MTLLAVKPNTPQRLQPSRRELIQSAVAAATIGAIRQPVTVRQSARHVAIVGAGLAGLSAAYELSQAGFTVTILEARLRAGGRVYTLREPFSDGLYAEAGALFIPGNHNLTLQYCRKFGLNLHRTGSRGAASLYSVHGKRMLVQPGSRPNWPVELTPEERTLGLDGMWNRYVTSSFAAFGDPTAAAWPSDDVAALDAITCAEFLRQRGASAGAISLLRLGYMDLWGDGIDSVSALTVLRDLALRQGEGTTQAIVGGNDGLPAAFAMRLKGFIKYGAALTRVEQDSNGVRLSFAQAGRNERLTADYAILAVPFSTLRKVEIGPGFSSAKLEAIRSMPYTSVTRVFLQCATRFWTMAGLPGEGASDGDVMWAWEPTAHQPGPRGILESYSTGAVARRIGALAPDQRVSSIARSMEALYPGVQASLEGGTSKCWDEDPWSLGDYAWFRPGQLLTLGRAAGLPEGRIHFAGEHTSPWPGWMQGALHSGMRAAREVSAAQSLQ